MTADPSERTRRGARPRVGQLHLRIERRLPGDTTAELYGVYREACDPLRTLAAARHVLTGDEFAAEMDDERIEKFLVLEAGRPVGLATMTNDLEAVPWISGDFYRRQYADAAGRGVLYYLGYLFVRSSHRRSKALILMTGQINRRLAAEQGVLAFDFCRYNDTHRIGRQARALLSSSLRIDALDVQAYYAADFRDRDDLGPPGRDGTAGGVRGGTPDGATAGPWTR